MSNAVFGITVDCDDAAELARFWADVLDRKVSAVAVEMGPNQNAVHHDISVIHNVPAVAVLGDNVPLRRAAVLAGLAGDEALDAADALARAQILDPLGVAMVCLSFVHPIVRSAIYQDRPAGTRARTHARAAQLLLRARRDRTDRRRPGRD